MQARSQSRMTEQLNRKENFMAVHELKTWPEYFRAVQRAEKRFEVRKDDRGFAVGDELILREYDPEKQEYTGRKLTYEVTYVLRDFPAIQEGYVVLSLRVPLRGPVVHCQISDDKVRLLFREAGGFLSMEQAATVLAKLAGIEHPSEPYQSENTDNWCFHAVEPPAPVDL